MEKILNGIERLEFLTVAAQYFDLFQKSLIINQEIDKWFEEMAQLIREIDEADKIELSYVNRRLKVALMRRYNRLADRRKEMVSLIETWQQEQQEFYASNPNFPQIHETPAEKKSALLCHSLRK